MELDTTSASEIFNWLSRCSERCAEIVPRVFVWSDVQSVVYSAVVVVKETSECGGSADIRQLLSSAHFEWLTGRGIGRETATRRMRLHKPKGTQVAHLERGSADSNRAAETEIVANQKLVRRRSYDFESAQQPLAPP